jgi:predicted CoA-binding protein
MNKKVLVFGYSDNPDRYANKAFKLLLDFDYAPVGFSPRNDDISQFNDYYHTLTLYVGEEISNKFSDEILKLKFDRLIFNPGSENINLEQKLVQKGVEVVHGCTLVMLKTDQF